MYVGGRKWIVPGPVSNAFSDFGASEAVLGDRAARYGVAEAWCRWRPRFMRVECGE
jgi:hypothetical protein